MIQFLAAMRNTIRVYGFMDTQGPRSIPKKGMHSEARENKWIEQIICQCTCDQNTSGVTDQVASLVRVF